MEIVLQLWTRSTGLSLESLARQAWKREGLPERVLQASRHQWTCNWRKIWWSRSCQCCCRQWIPIWSWLQILNHTVTKPYKKTAFHSFEYLLTSTRSNYVYVLLLCRLSVKFMYYLFHHSIFLSLYAKQKRYRVFNATFVHLL